MPRIAFATGTCLALIVAIGAAAPLRSAAPNVAAPVPDAASDRLARRVFPLLSAIQGSSAWRDALARDAEARRLMAARAGRAADCQTRPACAVEGRLWTPEELDGLVSAVERLRAHLPALPVIAGDTAAAALRRELAGINHVLGVYGLGRPPRYPKIDSAVWPVDSRNFRDSVGNALAMAAPSGSMPETALGDSWRLAIALLDVNDRDEAARFEPLDAEGNAPSIRAAARIDWTKYRYTAIVIPGAGPEDPDMPLSPGGKLRVALAAASFHAGLAPFLIVSGGNVHPNRTRFTEAVEMRRALVDRFGIPAERIVLEPYARHTTTNLRNAVRRLAAMGAPLARPALIVTAKEQLAYILGPNFAARNQEELGYQPGTLGAPLSEVEAPFLPSARSLEVDPADPLDP